MNEAPKGDNKVIGMTDIVSEIIQDQLCGTSKAVDGSAGEVTDVQVMQEEDPSGLVDASKKSDETEIIPVEVDDSEDVEVVGTAKHDDSAIANGDNVIVINDIEDVANPTDDVAAVEVEAENADENGAANEAGGEPDDDDADHASDLSDVNDDNESDAADDLADDDDDDQNEAASDRYDELSGSEYAPSADGAETTKSKVKSKAKPLSTPKAIRSRRASKAAPNTKSGSELDVRASTRKSTRKATKAAKQSTEEVVDDDFPIAVDGTELEEQQAEATADEDQPVVKGKARKSVKGRKRGQTAQTEPDAGDEEHREEAIKNAFKGPLRQRLDRLAREERHSVQKEAADAEAEAAPPTPPDTAALPSKRGRKASPKKTQRKTAELVDEDEQVIDEEAASEVALLPLKGRKASPKKAQNKKTAELVTEDELVSEGEGSPAPSEAPPAPAKRTHKTSPKRANKKNGAVDSADEQAEAKPSKRTRPGRKKTAPEPTVELVEPVEDEVKAAAEEVDAKPKRPRKSAKKAPNDEDVKPDLDDVKPGKRPRSASEPAPGPTSSPPPPTSSPNLPSGLVQPRAAGHPKTVQRSILLQSTRIVAARCAASASRPVSQAVTPSSASTVGRRQRSLSS